MDTETARAAWRRCRPLIEAALAYSSGFESIEDIERLVAEGTYQAWFGERSCAITEVQSWGQKPALVIVYCGGDLDELLDEMEPAAAAFARSIGCTVLMGHGRKGWERAAERRGFRFGYVTMVKNLVS